MKKTIIILVMLSLVLCLVAQQSQQIKKNKEITPTKKKMNYQAEYHKLDELYKKLHAQDQEQKLRWQHLEKQHNALKMSNKNSKVEIDALKKSNAMLQTKRQEYKVKWETSQKANNDFNGRFQKMNAENKALTKENAKLRAELEEFKPPKKKVLKKVTQQN